MHDPKQSRLYVLHATGSDLYKIGVTGARVPDRIAALQTGCPYRLREVGSVRIPADEVYQVEAACHEALHHQRRAGEWFQLGPATAGAVLDTVTQRRTIGDVSDTAGFAIGAPVSVHAVCSGSGDFEAYVPWVDTGRPPFQGEYGTEVNRLCWRAVAVCLGLRTGHPCVAAGVLLRVIETGATRPAKEWLADHEHGEYFGVTPTLSRALGFLAHMDMAGGFAAYLGETSYETEGGVYLVSGEPALAEGERHDVGGPSLRKAPRI